MERGKRRKPIDYTKGYRMEIMKIMLSCGIVSCGGFQMMNKEARMYSRKLQEMKREGMVEILRVGQKKVARFKDFENTYEDYISIYPLGYYGYYRKYGKSMGYNIANKSKDGKQRRDRAYKAGEVFMLMYGCGIQSLMEERPALNKMTDENTDKTVMKYYSISEIKNEAKFVLNVRDDEKGTVVNSRAFGCVVNDDKCMMVYHIGDKMQKWSNNTELQMAYSTSKAVQKICKVEGEINECVVITYGYAIVNKILQDETRGMMTVNNSGYKKMYWIPYTKKGKIIMNILCNPHIQAKIRDKYIEKESQDINKSSVDCDGIKEKKKILLFIIPDLVKLYRFATSAKWTNDKQNYEVICYDFQLPVIEEICGEYVTIKAVPCENTIL